MNARDFCFWIQGYTELTNGAQPTTASWKLILEHLELAKDDEDYSDDHFIGIIQLLSGFVSIAGTDKPTSQQWKRIVNLIQDAFTKVTSELDDLQEDINTEDILKEVLDEIKKDKQRYPDQHPPYLPPAPFPWKDDGVCPSPTYPNLPSPAYPNTDPWRMPPPIICKDGTGDNPNEFDTNVTSGTHKEGPSMSNVFCSSINDLEEACSVVGDMYNPVLCGIAGDMYGEGIAIARGMSADNNPFGYNDEVL